MQTIWFRVDCVCESCLGRVKPPNTTILPSTCPYCAPRGVWLQNNTLFWLQVAGLRAGPSAQTHALAAGERRTQLSHPHKHTQEMESRRDVSIPLSVESSLSYSVPMNTNNVLVWNTHGLNSQACRNGIRDIVNKEQSRIALRRVLSQIVF
jgi:hypothetical protein